MTKLSSMPDLLDLAQTRHELGHVIGAIDRGEPISVSSLRSEGFLMVPKDKLPAGFEDQLRQMAADLDDQIRNMGVDPDTPMVPEIDDEDDEDETA